MEKRESFKLVRDDGFLRLYKPFLPPSPRYFSSKIGNKNRKPVNHSESRKMNNKCYAIEDINNENNTEIKFCQNGFISFVSKTIERETISVNFESILPIKYKK